MEQCKRREICCDETKQIIYRNGGRSAELFDLEKEKCSNLHDTWMDYDGHSKMWYNEYNRNLLFVASFHRNNSMECMDVRCDKKWRIIRVPHKQHSLSSMFGVTLAEGTLSARLCI